MKSLKEHLNYKYGIYGGYDKFIEFLDLGTPYPKMGYHFRVSTSQIFRWTKLHKNEQTNGNG